MNKIVWQDEPQKITWAEEPEKIQWDTPAQETSALGKVATAAKDVYKAVTTAFDERTPSPKDVDVDQMKQDLAPFGWKESEVDQYYQVGKQEELKPAKDRTVGEWLRDVFTAPKAPSRARADAVEAVHHELAQQGIHMSLSEVDEQFRPIVQQQYGMGQIPTTGEMVNIAMQYAIGAGWGKAMLETGSILKGTYQMAKPLAKFMAADKALKTVVAGMKGRERVGEEGLAELLMLDKVDDGGASASIAKVVEFLGLGKLVGFSEVAKGLKDIGKEDVLLKYQERARIEGKPVEDLVRKDVDTVLGKMGKLQAELEEQSAKENRTPSQVLSERLRVQRLSQQPKEKTGEQWGEPSKVEIKGEQPAEQPVAQQATEPVVQAVVNEQQAQTPSRLAIRTQAKIMEKSGETLGENIASYSPKTFAEQAELAIRIIEENYEEAIKIATGELPARDGVLASSMYKFVEAKALSEGDTATLFRLGTSKIPTKASEAGQFIAFLRGVDPLSPVGAMQEVGKARFDWAKRTGRAPKTDVGTLETKVNSAKEKLDNHQANMNQPVIKGRYGSKNKIITTEAYEEAKRNFNRLASRMSAGVDPALAVELSKIGMYHIEAGARNFAAWSNKMVADLGEKVKPYLQEIWNKTNSVYNKNKAIETIKKGVEKGLDSPAMGLAIQKLARHFVESGIRNRDELVSKVHEVLKDIIPKITREETADAISGYGKFKPLSKDSVSVILRDIKGQLQQVGKIRDLNKKKPPLKSGVERRTPTQEERSLIKQVEELKRKYNIQTVDKETQLKSTLDGIKTRLRNEIEDLEVQIRNKAKTVKEKTQVTYDAEAEALKIKRDALKAKFDSIFGKNELTAQQKIARAKKILERSIKEYERRIKEKDMTPMRQREELHSAELDKLRSVRDHLKEEYQAMKEALNPKRTPEEIALQRLKTRLEHDYVKYRQRLQELDLAKRERKQVQLDAEGERLKQEYEAAKREWQAAAEATGKVTKEEAENIIRLSKDAMDARSRWETKIKENAENLDDYIKTNPQEMLEYGAKKVAFENYVLELKGEGRPISQMVKDRLLQTKAEFGENPALAVLKLGKDILQTIADNSIAMVATLDMSFLLRQGLKLFQTHPSVWWKVTQNAFKDFYKTMGGKNARDALWSNVFSRPNFMNNGYVDAKILHAVEEQFPSTLMERVPVIGRVFKASENSFVGSAVRARVMLYDLLESAARRRGVDTTNKVWRESMGKMINSLTAKGRWGKRGEGHLVRLILWAPRMLKANLDVLSLHGGTAGLQHNFAKKQAAMNLAKIIGETAMIMMVANAIKPGTCELDPTSSDFGKIKIGRTRFDITGGASTIVVLAARLAKGSYKSATTGKVYEYSSGFGKRSRMDALLDFIFNKASPPSRFVIDALKGKDWRGEKFSVGKSLYRAATPISLQQAIELGDDPSADAVAGVIADVFGASSWTEDKSSHKKIPW